MPRSSQGVRIQCEYFSWKLFQRDAVWYSDGRRNRPNLGKHSLNTRDRQEAERRLVLLDRAKAIELGLCQSATPKSESTTISIPDGWAIHKEHVSRSEITGGVSQNTLKRYRAVRASHEKFCRDNSITTWNDLTRRELESFAKHLAKKYAARTQYLMLTTVKSVHKLLIVERHLPETSRIHLPIPRPQGSPTYCYSQDQVAAMLDLCRANRKLEWLGEVILVLACTGLRIGELASLRWSDIQHDAEGTPAFISLTDEQADKRSNKSDLRRLKGRRGRIIPIHPRVVSLLQKLHRHRDGKLFHGPRGGRLKPDTLRNIFLREVINSLQSQFNSPSHRGFEEGRLHSFRHYFISECFKQGANESEIKSWVGHRDSRVVELYRHHGAEESRLKLQRLDLVRDREVTDGPSPDSMSPVDHNQDRTPEQNENH
jgi:integrase